MTRLSDNSSINTQTPELIILSPPLQGHRVPLEKSSTNQQDNPCYQLDLSPKAAFLSNFLPSTPTLTIECIDKQWMANAQSKHLKVNAEPVYTAIVDHEDIIQYGKLRCRLLFAGQRTLAQQLTPAPDILRNKIRMMAISATLTLSTIAAVTSYLVNQ